MRKLGSWGKDLVFYVSSDKVLTFKKLNREVSSRWASHIPTFGKPKREFLGADLETVTLDITLNAFLGVNITKTIKKLESALKIGRANYIVIGGKRIANYKFNLIKISEAYNVVYRDGFISEAYISLTFMEYH
jgi:hypothetical protein